MFVHDNHFCWLKRGVGPTRYNVNTAYGVRKGAPTQAAAAAPAASRLPTVQASTPIVEGDRRAYA